MAYRTGLTIGSILGGYGAVVAVWSTFAGFQVHGCAAGLLVGVLFVAILLSVGWLALIGLVALGGITCLWFKYNLGAALLLAANAAIVVTIGVFGPTEAGHADEVVTMFVLLVPAALAIGSILWTWTMRIQQMRDRIVVLLVVAVGLLPVAALAANGLAQDVALASTPTPAAAATGCGPSTG